MKSEIRDTARGRMLFLTDERIKIGVALDFGIRVSHLSVPGMDNLFYEQPADGSDGFTTSDGWKLYGGHRIWNTPESDTCNCPDNDPVDYVIVGNGCIIRQKEEPWRHIEKELHIDILADGRVRVKNLIRNCSDEVIRTAAWGVNTVVGGRLDIDFINADIPAANVAKSIAIWGKTNIADERITFTKDHLTAEYKPITDYFKIGIYTNSPRAEFVARKQKFVLEFDSKDCGIYPDNNSNFELFMSRGFMELESLGPVTELKKGECAEHTEYWTVTKEA